MTKIKIQRDGPVRYVILARSEKRNALDLEMLVQLRDAFSEMPAAKDRIVVLRAEGPVFCAGVDLRGRKPAEMDPSEIESLLHAIEHYPLPVVAIVQGDAIAGGNELALHCDFVIASESARFGMSLAKIGLAPTWFLAKKLLDVAGPVGAREMLLLGDLLPARRMAEMGLIHCVASVDELEATSDGVIARLVANAPLSLRTIKATLVRAMSFRDEITHADIDEMVAVTLKSADAREGVSALLEQRPPKFEGR